MTQQVPPPVETMVREYKNPRDFQDEAARLAAGGWQVIGQTEHRPRQGWIRVIMMGFILARIFPPKPRIVVTYERPLVPQRH